MARKRPRRRTILLAPNAFKGSFDAVEVAEMWRQGLAGVRGVSVELRPMSDGGDGFLAVVRRYRPRVLEVRARVRDPLGRPIAAAWGWDPDARAAFVESAAAIGLGLLGQGERDPLVATSAGLGGLLAAAHALGVRRISVGLGGSATVDGGLGMARALGFRFEDRRGRAIDRPAALERLARIVPPERSLLAGIRIAALADVDHPLLGGGGSAAVFGPQKGADPVAVARLERGLVRLAERWVADLGAPAGLAERRGAGAAGGLGAALAGFLGARLERGAASCARLAGLASALARADGVVTGEGRYDAQSEGGNKGSGWIVGRARRAGVPAVIACATADPEAAGRVRARGALVVDGDAAGLGTGRFGPAEHGALARAAVAALEGR